MVCRTKWMLTEIQIFNLISLYYWEEQKNNPVQSKPFFDGSARLCLYWWCKILFGQSRIFASSFLLKSRGKKSQSFRRIIMSDKINFYLQLIVTSLRSTLRLIHHSKQRKLRRILVILEEVTTCCMGTLWMNLDEWTLVSFYL